jgi:hypothetical protein
VELADRRTWPRPFAELARRLADRGKPEERWRSGEIDDQQFVEALGGAMVRGYHCTRLTPTEVGLVQNEGLHPLTAELVERNIGLAVQDGHLTADEGTLYLSNHLARRENRSGDLCLVGDRVDLSDPPAVGWLFSIWGGEAINMAWSTRSEESKRLATVGTPSVVAVRLDPATECSYAHPGIGLSAVRRVLSDEPGTELRTKVTLGPDRIEAIHHPGSAFWKRYVRYVPST